MKKILVTGGAGFIGSEFVRQCVARKYDIAVVDKLSYAGDLSRLASVRNKIRFYKADISNAKSLLKVFQKERPQTVVHFAAETHVDRSIADAGQFLKTNVIGTQVFIDLSRDFQIKKLVHISTDEVYGEIKKGSFKESHPFGPNNPYSASKAAAEMLIWAAIRTHGLKAVVVRPSNNYGPWQYPEKLIPVAIQHVLSEKEVPVYGQGLQKREWLFVEDSARAIELILRKGKLGEAYNVGGYFEKRNLDTVREILKNFGKKRDFIRFVRDRPGHDFRYHLDSAKMKKLGWKPAVGFQEGIRMTISWYLEHQKWLHKKNSFKRS